MRLYNYCGPRDHNQLLTAKIHKYLKSRLKLLSLAILIVQPPNKVNGKCHIHVNAKYPIICVITHSINSLSTTADPNIYDIPYGE